MKRKAIIYIRVSTDEQAEKGYSLQHQEERLRKYCELQNIEVVALFKDDHSAKTFNRPEFTKLLAILKKHRNFADLLLFTKWDRFSRNAGDAYGMINQLNKLGVEPQAMEQPLDLLIPENKIMLAVYLAAPEVENDRRALNVLVGMRRGRKEGRCMGLAPKGYKNTFDEFRKKVIAPNVEAPIIVWIFKELAKGIYNVAQIREMSKEKGLVCSKNNFWNIIRNPIYCGKINIPAYKDEDSTFVKGIHKPLISEELFYTVQDVLDGRKRNIPTKNTKREELPLRGFLKCRRCGKTLTGSASKGRSARYFYYHCDKGCKERFPAENANQEFIKELKKITANKEALDLYYRLMEDTFKLNVFDKDRELKKIQIEITRNSERLKMAQEKMLDNKIDAADYREIKNRYEPVIEKLVRKHIVLSSADTNYKKYIEGGFGLIKQVDYEYERGDLEIKQQIVGSFFPEKLTFENNQYRTDKVIDEVLLICRNNKAFGMKKNGTELDFSIQSQQG